MKIKYLISIIILLIISITGCTNQAGTIIKDSEVEITKTLTLEIVEELSKKGDELSWKDFVMFSGTDIGSGLYIMAYPIDENYMLLIGGGNQKEKPMYIYLENIVTEKRIDIRYDDIEEFLNKVSTQ